MLCVFEGPGCSSVGGGALAEPGPFKPTRKGLVKNPLQLEQQLSDSLFKFNF